MLNYYGTWTLFKRESKRFLKVYKQTILGPVVSNLLYLAIFGLSLHRAIPNIDGITYLQFLVPGLILMALINNAYQNPSSSLIIMKFQGVISDLLTIPLRTGEILAAFIGSAVLRALLVAAVTYLTTIYFVDLTYTSLTVIFASSLLISLFFSFCGMLIGIWANDFDRHSLVLNFILSPLIFLGGVFYPITSLPENLQTIFKLNPIVYMINLLRYGFTGLKEFPLTESFILLTAATIILGFVNYYLLKKGWRLQT